MWFAGIVSHFVQGATPTKSNSNETKGGQIVLGLCVTILRYTNRGDKSDKFFVPYANYEYVYKSIVLYNLLGRKTQLQIFNLIN